MKGDKVVLGITQGDINGIGYEVIIKSLLDNRIYDQMIPVIYGSPKVAAYHRKALNIENFSFNTVRTADEAVARRANIINCIDDATRVELGKSTPQAGEASYLALEAACADIEAGKIDALVTGPINKMNIQSDKFHFSGHTEYLKARFRSEHALMLMINDLMRVGVVTTHLPLSDVPSKVTQEAILEKLRILNDTLRIDFILSAPRIAVLSLNPHAGDEGLIGREEIEVINPALEQAKEEDILAFGPFPSDGFFGAGTYRHFDAVLAMYHDQGMIPFKALTIEGGVNFTAGLPLVRTSPAHGTAYDLAGKNEASADSFREAIYLACDLFNNRRLYNEISVNSLGPEGTDV